MDDPKQLIGRFVEELWNQRQFDVAQAIFARNSRQRQEDADTDVHRPPRRAGQDRRGLGARGVSRLLSATWSCPEHRGLGGQFLALTKQLLIFAGILEGSATRSGW